MTDRDKPARFADLRIRADMRAAQRSRRNLIISAAVALMVLIALI